MFASFHINGTVCFLREQIKILEFNIVTLSSGLSRLQTLLQSNALNLVSMAILQ